MEDAADLHRGDRGPLERAEQDAAERVAERDAVACLERVDLEAAQVAARLHLFDARGLKFDHGDGVTPSASSTRRRAAR